MQKKSKGKKGYVVAIDGPAGAGKSTVSRLLAGALGGRLLDTGAMYRSVAYFAVRENLESEKDLGKIARRLKFDVDPRTQALLVDGQDLGLKLRTPAITQLASHVSQFKAVRSALTRKQRSLGRRWSKRLPVIVEGRDIGSVVFPTLDFKFFVTANAEIRAKRRYLQLKNHGQKRVTLKKILDQQSARDKQDSTRKVAPLTCPEDAVLVDTSTMSVNQVVKFMQTHIEGHVQGWS